ncbi:hypothetical protein FRB99_006793 [Tulasnella sp. 403]|nr:hypothetical protein FRB99_006793 [Tulasnella sp. 403]
MDHQKRSVDDDDFSQLLSSVCGPRIASGPVCCTKEQVDTLQSNFQQAESIISSCPACRNNFRDFYCTFTCAPNQADFLHVTSTQRSSTNETAVKSLDFYVSEQFGRSFYDSCKDVKFSATNGYAMDFIGGGAKNYSAFLQYMGKERPGLGSPFQIDFPPPPNDAGLDFQARSCADNDPGSRCACIDCPSVCAVLPDRPPPNSDPVCHVGAVTCLTFVLVMAYALGVLSFFTGYALVAWKRKGRKYERVALSVDSASIVNQPAPVQRGLIGASSLALREGEVSSNASQDFRRAERGQSIMETVDSLQPRHYRLNTTIRRTFYHLGYFCASYPWVTLALASLFVGLLNIGWSSFSVETDPVRLWVSPSSETKLHKEYFDSKFGPFYRTEQVFVTAAPERVIEGGKGVLSTSRLQWWLGVEEDIRQLKSRPNGYTLRDVCFKPSGPRGACVVQSISAWLGNDIADESEWQERIVECASNPSECLPEYGQPLSPQFILGGVRNTTSDSRWLSAEAMIITYVVSDSLDAEERGKAEEWERELRIYLATVKDSAAEMGTQIAYSTGVSLEEEINQSTNTDFKIVAISYLAMFLYISFTLGRAAVVSPSPSDVERVGTPHSRLSLLLPLWVREALISLRWKFSRRAFINSKVLLGLFGIVLVIASVTTSVGLFSILGVKVTLIIAEVIPFLVLAVGVDNVFILVHELDRQNAVHGPNAPFPATDDDAILQQPMSPDSHRSPFDSSLQSNGTDALTKSPLPAEERIARTLAKMGPSILLSSITETIAFALGALVPMPAVRNFALYAAGSVLIGAILQVTAFVSALTLDLRREEDNRLDCFPCVRIHVPIALPYRSPPPQPTLLARFMRRRYAPFLLQDIVKAIVLAAFSGVFVASVISIQHIQLGLDQRLALPSTSYLVDYFNALDAYFNVGPPVYFVTTNTDVTSRAGQQHICGRFTSCDDYSVVNTLEGERNRPASSFIAEPPAAWFDDFFLWLDPSIESCCRVRKANSEIFCNPRDPERLCRPCFEWRVPAWNITLAGMPEGEEFMRYLQRWLISPTDDECPLGGRASYSSALALSAGTVEASHFRTFHTPLKSQSDYINAFAVANQIAADISERTQTTVFPYSPFYVFFEQYVHIVGITQEILGLGLAAVLIVTATLLGSWRTGTIVTGVVALTVVNVMGVMSVWGISLNAISLVNLVISLGIAVEFCSHIARSFMSAGAGLPVDHPSAYKERNERVWTALGDVGPSVLSGITFTKLIGMSVLALTRSKLLEIYYFRMWLTLIISGALHGLVLLPVVLSLAGGPGFTEVDMDEEWMSSVIRREDQEYAPFRTDSDIDDSD